MEQSYIKVHFLIHLSHSARTQKAYFSTFVKAHGNFNFYSQSIIN